MRRDVFTRLPIFACAALIAALFAANLWNFAVGSEWPKLRIRSAEPLWGVPGPRPVPWTLDDFLSGETQKAFSTGVGQSMPVFPIAVRAKNQFLYSVFSASGAPDIVVGKERQLFENFYVQEFCARGGVSDPKAIDEWAGRVRDIQTAVEAKGKRFVYLISPSKAARYSRYLPAYAPCPSVRTGTTEKLAPYRAALDSRGVTYVDGASLISAAMPEYSINLFPRGGTHWNYLGSAITVRELSHALNKDGKASPMPLYDFDWREKEEAQGTDRDLLNLLNLLKPDARYPTAAVAGRNEGSCAAAPKILAVGGSFLVEIVTNLVEAPCSASVDYWHYIRTAPGKFSRMRLLADRQDGLREHRVETDEDFEKSFANAQVVLLEENEAVIANMGQVPDLLAAAAK
ncbi:MAG: alginate O-acetyltransferase [Methylocystis sp.]|nr:MAG: alginate O-acetyltransferase [Methylocystis sp.]